MKEKFNPLIAFGPIAIGLAIFAGMRSGDVKPNCVKEISEKGVVAKVIREENGGGIDRARLIRSISRYEGRKNWAYDDSRGYRTVGVGFNLDRAAAREEIEELGVNYNNLYSGNIGLDDSQIDDLLGEDLDVAIADARRYVGDGFDKMPVKVREVVIDMAFNMGYSRLSGFRNFRTALRSDDYERAADEMVDSRWYGQVGRRSKELVEVMREVD